MNFLTVIMLVGGVGLLASTFGNALLAWLIARPLRNYYQPPSRLQTLEVLIPCFNEQNLISKTLESIADELANGATYGFDISISVGLDHCTDQTERQINQFIYDHGIDVRIIPNPSSPGKWNTIKFLSRQSSADWVALVDAGALWEPGLFARVANLLNASNVLGVAPSYCPSKASILETLYWKFESMLKRIESAAGGPTSVHGATVFYKQEMLEKALLELEGTEWLNDDVVIPLTLRTLFPQFKLIYLAQSGLIKNLLAPTAWIRDVGAMKSTPEQSRRKRMALGNIQWIKSLYWKAFRSDLSVGLIASRRVFRTFWAYGVLLITLGLLTNVSNFSTPQALVTLFIESALLSGVFYYSRAAFLAGLQVPIQLFKPKIIQTGNLWN